VTRRMYALTNSSVRQKLNRVRPVEFSYVTLYARSCLRYSLFMVQLSGMQQLLCIVVCLSVASTTKHCNACTTACSTAPPISHISTSSPTASGTCERLWNRPAAYTDTHRKLRHSVAAMTSLLVT